MPSPRDGISPTRCALARRCPASGATSRHASFASARSWSYPEKTLRADRPTRPSRCRRRPRAEPARHRVQARRDRPRRWPRRVSRARTAACPVSGQVAVAAGHAGPASANGNAVRRKGGACGSGNAVRRKGRVCANGNACQPAPKLDAADRSGLYLQSTSSRPWRAPTERPDSPLWRHARRASLCRDHLSALSARGQLSVARPVHSAPVSGRSARHRVRRGRP